MGLIGNPPAQALSTQGGRLPIVLPDGLGPLNVGFGRRLLGLADDLPRGLRLLVGDHDPRVGQVHADTVGVVAEDLYPQAVGDHAYGVGVNLTDARVDPKSTRLNSSHQIISYA